MYELVIFLILLSIEIFFFLFNILILISYLFVLYLLGIIYCKEGFFILMVIYIEKVLSFREFFFL